jgi:MFS family permease
MASSFQSHRDKVLGFAESASGLGLMIGPLLGGGINNIMGYLPAYMVFAGLLFISGTICMLLLPNKLNGAPVTSQVELDKERVVATKNVKVKMSWFFANRRCMFALVSS